ncbi:MAG: branched-chain amino acid ABC transporter permease [Deltaproteobacteria bacterium]|nr:branched-chain amino acid ABC transporter permease [Deltaproteobacteria bacterium]MBW2342580.1 branched-chain amino acid ABC transporter permease [Deltaproteobacteria bacterium]
MFYRECGNFKDSYASDMAIFPIPLDRWGFIIMLFLAFVIVPLFASEYLITNIIIPFYCFALSAFGLNVLAGYAGQISLGHAAFMAVGAYSSFILYGRYGIPLMPSILGAGVVTAIVGTFFGLPSLRIKGFYLAIATLASQFIIEWVIVHVHWISGGVFGTIEAPNMFIFGWELDTAVKKYYFALCITVLLMTIGKNLVRGQLGRNWMAIRDVDYAAEIIGVNLYRDKLTAFAVSTFYAGVAGALIAFCYVGVANIEEFNVMTSFALVGMIIIGGLGTVLGSFFGAGFFVILPIAINHFLGTFMEVVPADILSNIESIVFGGLIVFFLIVEPYGMARLWHTIKDKMRLWPFPY